MVDVVMQKFALTIGAAVGALIQPARADLVATLVCIHHITVDVCMFLNTQTIYITNYKKSFVGLTIMAGDTSSMVCMKVWIQRH